MQFHKNRSTTESRKFYLTNAMGMLLIHKVRRALHYTDY